MGTVFSVNRKHRVTTDDISTCKACRGKHGQIYAIFDIVVDEPPLHEHCRCYIEPMEAIYAGQATDKAIDGDVYQNRNKHLPDAPGRIWYEADINYVSGRRNSERFLYSNDGLIFVTYDHYKTFYEII